MTYFNSNFIHPKIKDDTKEFKNREHTTFHKIKPNKEDLQALTDKITEALVTTQPEINPSLYLWEGQLCNLCDHCCVEKLHRKLRKTENQHNNWLATKMDAYYWKSNHQIAQMNITKNGRNTKANNKWKTNIKAKKNWKWMRSEIKNKITKQRLQQLKEKKINQLRSKKMQKKRKFTSHNEG